MLKLERRPLTEFLDQDHRTALDGRIKKAQEFSMLAASSKRSQQISDAWNNFRQGKTARGTCDALWSELKAMSFHKCSFCEIPEPNTIEHIEEKAKAPERMFSWTNLLAACSMCNTTRQNSGIFEQPINSSVCEPLDYLGWDELSGKFVPNPQYKAQVDAHVDMYKLNRLDQERKYKLLAFKHHLLAITRQTPPTSQTKSLIEEALKPNALCLGPVREYLLRPPTVHDKWLIKEALRCLPEINDWVKLWLRPGSLGGDIWSHATP